MNLETAKRIVSLAHRGEAGIKVRPDEWPQAWWVHVSVVSEENSPSVVATLFSPEGIMGDCRCDDPVNNLENLALEIRTLLKQLQIDAAAPINFAFTEAAASELLEMLAASDPQVFEQALHRVMTAESRFAPDLEMAA